MPITGTLAPESLLSLSLQEALVIMASVTHWLCNSGNLGPQTKRLFVFPAGFTESRDPMFKASQSSGRGQGLHGLKNSFVCWEDRRDSLEDERYPAPLMTGNMASLGHEGEDTGRFKNKRMGNIDFLGATSGQG